jgi:uncharacterized protein (TIGR00730 family)
VTFDPVISTKSDEAFSQARRRVFFQRVLGFFTRHPPSTLLSLEQVRSKLRIHGQHYRGTETIPIDRIVGSVGRYREFNREFLPTQEFLRDRWKHIYDLAHGATGFAPIDVYQVGDVYFVRDGHHRVSVLSELGATSVEATVTELDTPVPMSADVAEGDLDLKEEYATFLEVTGLNVRRPGQDLEFTLPGQYQKLHEHIAVHRYFLGQREKREIPYAEGVERWYDEVYSPVVQLIREEGILEQFPGRTEADLYLWITEHRHYLGERYGQEVPLEEAAAQFSWDYRRRSAKKELVAGATQEAMTSEQTITESKIVAVFGSGSAPADHPVLRQAGRLGGLLAAAGFTLVSGGYGGTMEASSRGARQAGSDGGKVIGVTMDLFTPPLHPNPWLTEEQRVSDFFPRLRRLTSADAFVVLRGGIGTLTEATLVWSLLQTGQISPRPFIFVGEGWRRLFDAFRVETFMSERDFALATVVGSVDQAVNLLRDALAPRP